MLTVDIHAHLYDERYLEELGQLLASPKTPVEQASARMLERTLTIPASRDLDERRGLMERIGVDYQVLSLSMPMSYDGDAATRLRLARLTNDRFARAVQDHPRHFFAVATLPLPDVDASLVELERCLDELGMVGVGIGSNIRGRRLDDPELTPVFEELDLRGTTLLLHPNIPVCSGPDIAELNLGPSLAYIFDTGITVYRMILSGMLDRFRRLKVVVPHLGGMLPYLTGRIEEGYRAGRAGAGLERPPAAYLADLYYDTLIGHQPSLQLAKRQFGAERLMLGSDFPLGSSPLEDAVQFVLDADLTDPEREQVLGATAVRVLGLPVAQLADSESVASLTQGAPL